MERIQIHPEDKKSINQLKKALKSKELNKLYYIVLDQILVHKSTVYDDYNDEYIKEHNYLTLDLPRDGGTIVGFPKDIHILYFVDEETFIGIPKEIMELNKFFGRKKYKSMIVGNDFLVEGYKVASFSIKRLNPKDKKLCVAIIVDYDIDLDIIKNICKKEMKKVPRGLKNFKIKYEDILNVLNIPQ